jgi:hypothetical protein
MSCKGCGRTKKNIPPKTDKRGNGINYHDKYAYLNPNQLAAKKAQEDKDREGKE